MDTAVLNLHDLETLEKISKFIASSNITSTGNISYLPVERLISFRDLNAIAVGLVDKESNLYGTIFTIPINTHKRKFGCTTFLCLDSKVRNQGNVRSLRNKLIEIAEQQELYFGYHTTDLQLSPNAIQIQSWFIPKDIQVARKIGYPCIEKHRHSQNHLQNTLTVSKVTLVSDLLFQPTRYCFLPDDQWLKHFPTYQITNNGIFVGIFSLNKVAVKITQTNQEATLDQICWSFGSSIIDGAMSVSMAPVIIGYLVGSISLDDILQKNGRVLSHEPWTSLYGTEIRIKHADLYLPLL